MRVFYSVQCVSYKRQGYARQAGAMSECLVANACYRSRNNHFRYLFTFFECFACNFGHGHSFMYRGNHNLFF